jgi:hypothetical protein
MSRRNILRSRPDLLHGEVQEATGLLLLQGGINGENGLPRMMRADCRQHVLEPSDVDTYEWHAIIRICQS